MIQLIAMLEYIYHCGLSKKFIFHKLLQFYFHFYGEYLDFDSRLKLRPPLTLIFEPTI